jgi:hypothetical protein
VRDRVNQCPEDNQWSQSIYSYEWEGIYKESWLKQTQNEFRIEVFGPAWLAGLEQDHRSVLGEVTCMKDRHSKNLTRTWWNVSQMQQASHNKARNKIVSHFYQIIY